jgi:CheY-like chemotaxis protein
MLACVPDSGSDLMRVLVVDDDEGIRDMLVAMLVREGHIVLAIASAEEALRALPESTYDVAFIDHNLPGLDGVVFGEYLRRAHPEMAVALVTGDDNQKMVRHARRHSMTFIAKPFPIAAILEVVDHAKKAKASRRAKAGLDAEDTFAAPIARFAGELDAMFTLPNVPRRTHDALIDAIKGRLHALRQGRAFDERDRVAALAGLLTARVLGTELPRLADGRTLFEEYDDLMRRRGRRTEFSGQ